VAAVLDECRRREREAWDLLGELVGVPSGVGDVEGLEIAARRMARAWGSIGFETSIGHTAGGLPMLIANRGFDEGAPVILLLGHLDTVFERDTGGWAFAINDGRATGPGIADAKGAAVVGWLGVASALAATAGLPKLNLRVLMTSDEESGSVSSRGMIEEAALAADLALVYEPARPDGSIVRGRRGARRYRIRVTGKAAHAGGEPWDGVNAIEAAAHKVLALQALNNRSRAISVTVSVAHGGRHVNIVPDEAILDVDTRLPDQDVAATTHATVEQIVGRTDLPGSTATYELLSDRPVMTPHPDLELILERFRGAARHLGFDLRDVIGGGASDGAFTSALGVPTLDGLGPVGGGFHTRDEYLVVDTLVDRSALTAAVLATLAG
jgi:glutamate carboxypeptidase